MSDNSNSSTLEDIQDAFGFLIDSDESEEPDYDQPFTSPLNNSDDDSDDEYDDEDNDDEVEEIVTTNSLKDLAQPVKRGRGRPRKISVDNPAKSNGNSTKKVYPKFAKQLTSATLDDDNCFTFNEFGKLDVVYKNITDPDGNKSNYFNVFSKMDGAKSYSTSSITLSKKYVCINMEDLISEIKNTMTVDESELNISSFVVEWVGKTERELKAIESQVQKDLFLVVSGFDSEKIFEVKNTLIELSISNSYDGKSSFQISFNFSFTTNDGTVYKDFFTINDFTNKYLHKGVQINDIQDSIKNIDEEQIVKYIKAMKKYKLSEIDIRYIRNKLNKDNSKKFADFIDNCPDKYNNLYFCLLALSNILNKDYSSDQRSGLNQVVRSISSKAMTKYTIETLKKEKEATVS